MELKDSSLVIQSQKLGTKRQQFGYSVFNKPNIKLVFFLPVSTKLAKAEKLKKVFETAYIIPDIFSMLWKIRLRFQIRCKI